MPEDTDLLIGVGFVAFCLILLLYILVLAPRRQRRRVAAALLGRGWSPCDPAEPSAAAMLRLAIAGPGGTERSIHYSEKLGPLTREVDVQQKIKGHADQLFRDPAGRHPRFAATGLTHERTVSRDSLSVGSDKRGAFGRYLWIGEARPLRVEKAETVYDAIGEMFGESMRRLAQKRGVAEGALPSITPPAEDDRAQRLRELLRVRKAVGAARAALHVSPEAWVLSAPLASGASRIESLVEVAAEISAHLD